MNGMIMKAKDMAMRSGITNSLMMKKKRNDKAHKVMSEFKRGILKSGGGGKIVTNRRQGIAIALSEARNAGAISHKHEKQN